MVKNTKKVEKKKNIQKNVSKVVKKKVVCNKSANKTKRVVKKPVNKSASKKVAITSKVQKNIEKKEPWYIWLKDNIIENEEKYSKEYKGRRTIVAIFMVFCFFTVLFSTSIVDYNYAYKNKTTPLFVIKTRDEYKQVTIYYGMFYKAWRCDNGLTSINFSRFKTEISYCTIVANYNDEGIYTNPNGVKISESQMNIIKNYYYDDYVYFKTSEELENAYKISKEINKVWWVRKVTDNDINNDESMNLAIFGKVESKNGIDEWNLQYDNPEYYKCVKNVDGVNVFASYNHLDNTCDTIWKSLSLDETTCSLAQNSSEFVKDLVKLSGLCK